MSPISLQTNEYTQTVVPPKEKKSLSFLEKDTEFPPKDTVGPVDLCLESLKLLQSCAAILSMIYNMPKCPNFNLTHRMNIDTNPQLVDVVIQNVEVVNFNQSDLDQISLASASVLSAPKNQPYVVETLFKLIRDLIVNPGINFGLYCINHILLPMVQNWLRQNVKVQKPGEVWQNFKHCCGLASDDNIMMSGDTGSKMTKSKSCHLWVKDDMRTENKVKKESPQHITPRLNPFMNNSIPPTTTCTYRNSTAKGYEHFQGIKIKERTTNNAECIIVVDSDAYKTTRIETMEACLELLSSLSSEKLSPLATILKQGAVLLVGAQDEKIKKAAEVLLQRMNISFIDHDNY
ncbi:hypothetical protein NQ317_000234 [Molorchus minor]|uniref:Uncharacterized protein n=1 Tax=Molorchus minor TaxID=1323400 RepID=A0ABQ9JVE6_9CUCU|nr:hypothetical protein NQ317_000234 [Molorchus minor]